MPSRSSKRPRDANQLAKLVVDLATGQVNEEIPNADSGKNPAAVALGRLGGKKGGAMRAQRLTPERRKEIAIRAAAVHW